MKLGTKTEIANELGISVSTLKTIIEECDAIGYKVGKRFYYDAHFIKNKIKEEIGTSEQEPTVEEHIKNSERVRAEDVYKELSHLHNELINRLEKQKRKYKAVERQLHMMEESYNKLIRTRVNEISKAYDKLDKKIFTPSFFFDYVNIFVNFRVTSTMLYSLEPIYKDMENGETRLIELKAGTKTETVSIMKKDNLLVKIKKEENK